MKPVYIAYLFTILLVFAGCINKISDDEELESSEEKTITFAVNYKMSSMDTPNTKADSNLGSFAKELILYDYVNGQKMQEKLYSSSDKNYGHIEIALTKGIHNLVFIAHNSEVTDFIYPNLSFDKLKDTFTFASALTIDNDTNSEQPITLSRAVGKIFVTAIDAIPDAAGSLRITINSYYPTFDVTTAGPSGTPLQEVREFAYSAANKGVKNSTYTIYCFADNDEYTTDMMIDLLDAQGDVLYSNKLNDVPIKRNMQTKITGTLFSFIAWSSITVQSEWADDIIYPL